MIGLSSASAVDSVFHDACFPSVGCFDGLDNFEVPGTPYLAPPDFRSDVWIFGSIERPARSGDGTLDPGLDGVVGGGDAQFELVVSVVGPGVDLLEIAVLGTPAWQPESESIFTDPTDLIQIQIHSDAEPLVVPEPGSAVLLGLGCLALARVRST